MKTFKTVLASFGILFSSAAMFAVDGPTLTEVPLTPVEDVVPTHYESNYNKMEYGINDGFDYDVYAYDLPTSATPAPVMEQVDDTTFFVPASSNKPHNVGDIWDYEYANQYIYEFTIPAGQSLKYIDVWGRAVGGVESRNANLVIELYNDAAVSVSRSFSCTKQTADYPAFKRVDLAEQGFTDNLLNFATGVRIRHNNTKRKEFLNLAEFRLCSEDNPFSWTEKPVILSDSTTTGDLDQATDLFVGFNGQSNATLYLVPTSTAANVLDIQLASVKKFTAEPDTAYRVWTGQIEIGTYNWYALDLAGNISEPSAAINFIADVNIPLLETTGGEFTETTWLSMMGNERSRAYLVKSTVENTAEAIRLNAFKEIGLVGDGETRYMSTYNVPVGEYNLYAIDSSANVSAASDPIKILQRVPKTYMNYAITSAIGGEPHYGVGTQLSEPRYLYNDLFSYDPNDVLATKPDQTNTHGDKADNAIDTAGFFPKNYDAWWTIYFDIPMDQKIDYIDVWGRLDGGGVARNQNLIFTLTDTLTGESWSSLPWSDMTTNEENPPAYGRYWFNTSDVQPAHLLYTANSLTARQGRSGEFIATFETRVGGAEWENTPPAPAIVSAAIVDSKTVFTVEGGKEATLDASITFDPDKSQTLTYAWISPMIQLSAANIANPTFTAPAYKAAGGNEYSVMLQVSDGVITVPFPVIVKVVETGSAINAAEVEGFKVYPNPSNSLFNLDFTNATESSMIKVTDLTGKQLYANTAAAGSHHSINVTELTQGVCILYVESGDKKMVRSLIVK